MGIEPTALAWEARVLPLYDARLVLLFGNPRTIPMVLYFASAAHNLRPAAQCATPLSAQVRQVFRARPD